MNKMQGKITIVPTTKITGSIKSSMVYPALEDLTVKSSSEEQQFKPKAYGFSNVTVEPVVELQGDILTVSPSTSTQKIVPESPANGFTEVNVNAVTADIDSNIVPENIANGVEILGVKGDFKGKPETNVFMQETEPEKKDGIWLQGNYEVENIIADTDVITGEKWNTDKMNSLRSIPYNFIQGRCASVGTDIYLFGGSTGCYKYAYKYNSLTDVYTKLTDIPYDFHNGSAITVGTNIYLFGSAVSSYVKYAYKYNTLTDTYTKLEDLPYEYSSGDVAAIGTDIYLFGVQITTTTYAYKYAYKYNTLTDTYTKLTNIPIKFGNGRCAAVGKYIYLFGGAYASTSTYRYNPSTNAYTQLANIPTEFYQGSCIANGTDIYLFGSNNSTYNKYAYKYDTITGTYTKLSNMLFAYSQGDVAFNGTDVYLFGGYSNKTKVQVMSYNSKTYPNKSIIISQDLNDYSTNIADIGITNLKTFYNRVYYRDTNGQLLNNIPTYNGNGTKWTRI